MPEITGNNIKDFDIIGCPGCYPYFNSNYHLAPLIIENSINTKNIIIDSKSGYSGAGRGVHKKYKHKNLYNTLSAYGVGFHRHNSEIYQELKNYTRSKINFIFTPHLTPMFKGILSTIYVDLNNRFFNKKDTELILKKFHKKNQFVKILKNNSLLSTNDVINSK